MSSKTWDELWLLADKKIDCCGSNCFYLFIVLLVGPNLKLNCPIHVLGSLLHKLSINTPSLSAYWLELRRIFSIFILKLMQLTVACEGCSSIFSLSLVNVRYSPPLFCSSITYIDPSIITFSTISLQRQSSQVHRPVSHTLSFMKHRWSRVLMISCGLTSPQSLGVESCGCGSSSETVLSIYLWLIHSVQTVGFLFYLATKV